MRDFAEKQQRGKVTIYRFIFGRQSKTSKGCSYRCKCLYTIVQSKGNFLSSAFERAFVHNQIFFEKKFQQKGTAFLE